MTEPAKDVSAQIQRALNLDYMRRLRAGQPTEHRPVERCDQCGGKGQIDNFGRKKGEARKVACPLCGGEGYVAEALNILYDRCVCDDCCQPVTVVIDGCGVGHTLEYCADSIPDQEAAAELAKLGAMPERRRSS